jgi:uncharacterized protein YqeY
MLRERFTEALKTAMKDRDQARVSAVRLIIARLKERDIEARAKGNAAGIPDGEIQQMLQGMVKQRRESIELYQKGGREELAQKERAEIAVIEGFLPRQMDEAAMESAIKAVIAELGAASPKDMGRVMGALKERHAGAMDFSRASPIAKRLLG